MITFQVPLPPRELSSNGQHGHWTKVAKARKDYRNECYVAGRETFEKDWDYPVNVRISVVFCIKDGRKAKRYQPRDAANALSAFKAGIDGLCDSGMAQDDDKKHLELGRIVIDPTRGPFVEVTVEPV